MYKDLVVNLAIRDERDVATDYAGSIAEAFDAHVCGIAFEYEPVVVPTFMGGVPTNLIEAQRAESRKAAETAIARFEAAMRRSRLSAEHRILAASPFGAAEQFGGIARRFDLSVVAQVEPEKPAPQQFVTEAALFESGRPVVIVPYIQKQGLRLDRVVVCWDASRTAARAVADALPLLIRAKSIHVLTVSRHATKPEDLPAADISQHLARHGLNVNAQHVVAPDIAVGSAILSYVADSSADFLVMGGYGHSRMRQIVLGGVTREILASMTVPTLMSH